MKTVILETKEGPRYLHKLCLADNEAVISVRATPRRRDAARFDSDVRRDDAASEINQRLAIGLCGTWLLWAR